MAEITPETPYDGKMTWANVQEIIMKVIWMDGKDAICTKKRMKNAKIDSG